jgi:hypothetical protein
MKARRGFSSRLGQLGLLAGLLLIAGVSSSNAIAFSATLGARPNLPAAEYDVYLPLFMQLLEPFIYGRVTVNGQPAGNVDLSLIRQTAQGSSVQATATTNTQGVYMFADVPSVAIPDSYLVEYFNAADSTRLRSHRQVFTNYIAGNPLVLEDFDIADIELLAPASGTTLLVPPAPKFYWTPRLAAPDDRYVFVLYAPGDDPAYYQAPPTSGGQITLTSMPAGFSYGVEYAWTVRSLPNWPSTGIEAEAFDSFSVTISPAISALLLPQPFAWLSPTTQARQE